MKRWLARSVISTMVVAGAAAPSYSQDQTVYEPSDRLPIRATVTSVQ
jgi:hypothetical protein